MEDRRKTGMQKIDNYIGRKNYDPDLSMFLLGMDLTNFGLNLTDNEYNSSQLPLILVGKSIPTLDLLFLPIPLVSVILRISHSLNVISRLNSP